MSKIFDGSWKKRPRCSFILDKINSPNISDNARHQVELQSWVVPNISDEKRRDKIHNTTAHRHLYTHGRIPCVHHPPVLPPASRLVRSIPAKLYDGHVRLLAWQSLNSFSLNYFNPFIKEIIRKNMGYYVPSYCIHSLKSRTFNFWQKKFDHSFDKYLWYSPNVTFVQIVTPRFFPKTTQ